MIFQPTSGHDWVLTGIELLSISRIFGFGIRTLPWKKYHGEWVPGAISVLKSASKDSLFNLFYDSTETSLYF